MTGADIYRNLQDLNQELKRRELVGEISLVDDAVMYLVFKSRISTADIDAIFEPKTEIYDCIDFVARKNGLSKDWLNDSIKGFSNLNTAQFLEYISLSNLTILTATPEYMLAMKCLSSRVTNENERKDIEFLIQYLNLSSYSQVEDILLKFYPEKDFWGKDSIFYKGDFR